MEWYLDHPSVPAATPAPSATSSTALQFVNLSRYFDCPDFFYPDSPPETRTGLTFPLLPRIAPLAPPF